jgi:hypothetical protein
MSVYCSWFAICISSAGVQDTKNYCVTVCVIIFWNSENGMFFLASNKLTANLPTKYLNSGFSVEIAWTSCNIKYTKEMNASVYAMTSDMVCSLWLYLTRFVVTIK